MKHWCLYTLEGGEEQLQGGLFSSIIFQGGGLDEIMDTPQFERIFSLYKLS